MTLFSEAATRRRIQSGLMRPHSKKTGVLVLVVFFKVRLATVGKQGSLVFFLLPDKIRAFLDVYYCPGITGAR